MAKPAAGESQTGSNIGRLKVGKFRYNLFGGQTIRQEIKDVADPDSHASDTRPTTALFRVNRDSFVEESHGCASKWVSLRAIARQWMIAFGSS